MRPSLLLPCILSIVALPSGARGQEPQPTFDISSVRATSAGMTADDDRILGGGPDWRAEFTASGFEFTPAFGRHADRTWPLRYRVESMRRAHGLELISDPTATPRVADGTVEYVRSASITERYDARVDGVEQSFVLKERPQGFGDLLVQGGIDTDLSPPTAHSSDGRLAFSASGLGQVTIGGVTAIDATGRSVGGTTRFVDGTLEYAVPAAFLDEASYPVVVDPLFGSAFTVASGFDESSPDVSFDASTGRFLVVWQRTFASSDSDIRGQFINADATFAGGLIAIASDTAVNAVVPRVGNVNASNHFVVVWNDATGFLNGSVRGRTVLANNGSLGPAVTIGSATALTGSPDVGGEFQESYPHAMVVWHQLDTTTLMFDVFVARLTISAFGTLTVGTPVAIGTGFDDSQPAISSTGGPNGIYLAVWKRNFNTTAFHAIRGAAFDRNLNVIDSFIPVSGSGGYHHNPAVDGDGNSFLVAYEKEPTLNSGDKDVYARLVYRTPDGQFTPDGAELGVDAGVLNSDAPDVAWLPGQALVAFRQLDLTNKYRAMLVGFDPHGGSVCEGYYQLSSNSENTKSIHVCAATDDFALVAFEADPLAGGAGSIRAQRFLAKDGVHHSLGGGCGPVAYASCARIGNPSFRLSVEGAPAQQPSYMILGATTINVPCGSCALTVDPASGLFLFTGPTSQQGTNHASAAIPNNPTLVGLKFATQWMILDPSKPCPSLQSAFSNGIEITLE